MSKLNIDQRTILNLLTDKKVDFLIPDYQRPYAWGEDECSTLWEDLFAFAIPGGDCTQFDDNEEYFLGPIVTFKNDDGKLEIIDGQQRLTTIMLLLRAFYPRFEHMQDDESVSIRQSLERCIWKTNEFDKPFKDQLKIDSEVASDNDKDEFLSILRTGDAGPDKKSRYARNYRFFDDQIAEFIRAYPSYTPYLPNRIMRNVILLPIEADSQSTALRIFSTLNDRGMPLSDSDIFKSQFYKYYTEKGEKDEFVKRWRDLEELCERIFKPMQGTPMDELFSRYMYYLRAKEGNRNTTTEALRNFFERDNYAIFKSDGTLEDLEDLAAFWEDVYHQEDCFSNRVLRRLFVLNYAPNSMWTYIVSTYFMANRDSQGNLDDRAFYDFLSRITAFIWAYAIYRPGVNALRGPVYPELINIVNGDPVTFKKFKFDRESIRSAIKAYTFTNGRPITRSMLTWWAYTDDAQTLFDIETKLDIEHIFSKRRADFEDALVDRRNIEGLGNKALLEKRINIRAADYQFKDKKKYYLGYTTGKGKEKKATKVVELLRLAEEKDDFTERDIEARTESIIDAFVDYLGENELLSD